MSLELRKKLKDLRVIALTAFILCSSVVRAQPHANATQSEHSIIAEFRILFTKIKGKLEAVKGTPTADSLAPELDELDRLLARYSSEKSNEVASVQLMKARLYLEVFEESEKAIKTLRLIKTDYPNTEIGKNVDKIIAQVENQQTKKSNQLPTEGKSRAPETFYLKGRIIYEDQGMDKDFDGKFVAIYASPFQLRIEKTKQLFASGVRHEITIFDGENGIIHSFNPKSNPPQSIRAVRENNATQFKKYISQILFPYIFPEESLNSQTTETSGKITAQGFSFPQQIIIAPKDGPKHTIIIESAEVNIALPKNYFDIKTANRPTIDDLYYITNTIIPKLNKKDILPEAKHSQKKSSIQLVVYWASWNPSHMNEELIKILSTIHQNNTEIKITIKEYNGRGRPNEVVRKKFTDALPNAEHVLLNEDTELKNLKIDGLPTVVVLDETKKELLKHTGIRSLEQAIGTAIDN